MYSHHKLGTAEYVNPMQPPTSPAIQERRFTPFIRALVLFLGYEIITFGVSIGSALILGQEISDTGQNMIRLLLLVIYVTFIVFLIKKINCRTLRVVQWGMSSNAAVWFLITLAITGAIMAAAAIISNTLWPTQLVAPEPTGWETIISGFVAAFILQGSLEELAFRGYLPQTLTTTPVKTFVTTSVIFMAMHWHFILQYQGVDILYNLLFPLTFGTFTFTMMYVYQTIWAAVAVHGDHITHTTLEIPGYADGGLRVLVQSILFALATACIFYLNRNTFKPEHNRLVYT